REVGEAVSRRALARAGEGDVPRAGAVTGLTAHVDLGPRGRVVVGARVVALLQLGRVAGRAHRVPALIAAGPGEHVAGRRLLVGIEMEPSPCGYVPRDRERLEPAAGLREQILLQRIDPEGVRDLEVGERAIGSVGVDDELPVATEEARDDAVAREL